MTRWLWLVVVLIVGLTVSGRAAAGPRTFVLIVTNNRSLDLGRPDLQYADDDAVKYYELFRAAARHGGQLHLLTELDRDTERLFPSLREVAVPPSKKAVLRAAERIAAEAARARRAGDSVDFYLVYAGHGDIEGGRGFLELKDGRLYAEELEALLKKVPSTRSHVIVDSCNSFFVINARRPGGRRFATPADAARSLSKRLPNVGVFLSTSAEADVFEWSELQSGIFSHAVRSGLSGAADANGDGAVSYAELRAFVDIAASGVKNPAYRPRVYARGPAGDDRTALLVAGATKSSQLRVDREREVRLTIRDSDGLPWIDTYKERGAPLVLNLAPERLTRAVVEERAPASTHAPARLQFDAELGPVQGLETLAMAERHESSRGDGELFAMLFTRPFGPRAFAEYERTKEGEAPPVFGISRDDTERMNALLTHVGELERDRRVVSAATGLTLGAGFAGAGAWMAYQGYQEPDRERARSLQVAGWTTTAIGAVGLTYGTLQLLLRSPEERLQEEFARGLAAGEDPALVVARADKGLHEAAASYRQMRLLLRWSGVGITAASAGVIVLNEVRYSSEQLWGSRIVYGSVAITGGLVFASSYIELPVERFVRLWDSDPGIRRLPRLSLAPLPSGAALTLQGEY